MSLLILSSLCRISILGEVERDTVRYCKSYPHCDQWSSFSTLQRWHLISNHTLAASSKAKMTINPLRLPSDAVFHGSIAAYFPSIRIKDTGVRCIRFYLRGTIKVPDIAFLNSVLGPEEICCSVTLYPTFHRHDAESKVQDTELQQAIKALEETVGKRKTRIEMDISGGELELLPVLPAPPPSPTALKQRPPTHKIDLFGSVWYRKVVSSEDDKDDQTGEVESVQQWLLPCESSNSYRRLFVLNMG